MLTFSWHFNYFVLYGIKKCILNLKLKWFRLMALNNGTAWTAQILFIVFSMYKTLITLTIHIVYTVLKSTVIILHQMLTFSLHLNIFFLFLALRIVSFLQKKEQKMEKKKYWNHFFPIFHIYLFTLQTLLSFHLLDISRLQHS